MKKLLIILLLFASPAFGEVYPTGAPDLVATYSLTVDVEGVSGADKFTYNTTEYTTDQTFTGLTADASFTVTADTGRQVSCTGTGLTDNLGGSYTANTDSQSVTAVCAFSASGAASVTDDFNRSDGAIGANWTAVSGQTAPLITSNALTADGSVSRAYYSGTTFSGDQYSQADVTSYGSAGVLTNVQAGAATYYSLRVVGGNSTINLYRVVAGSSTTLKESISCSGSVYRLENNAGALKVYADAVECASAATTDTNITGGYPGIYLYSGDIIDDFAAADL